MSTATLSPEAAPSRNGRDHRGRFTKGNAGGPGNPFARKASLLRSVAIQCLSTADMQVIIERLIYFAREGHIPAIKLLFQYTLGKPIEGQHPDEVDFDDTDDQEPPATVDALCDMLRSVERETQDRKLKDELQREKRALARLAREKMKQEQAHEHICETSTDSEEPTASGNASESPSMPSSPSANGKTRQEEPTRTHPKSIPSREKARASHERRRVSHAAMPQSANGDHRMDQDDVYADVKKQLHDSAMERFQQIFESWEQQRGCKHSPPCSPSRNGQKR
ncbi:MAG: hypothetical protein ACKO23_13730 [Gemmataceae bacterium]